MKLVVGLGNPEPKYANTRHNFGFMVIDNFLKNFEYKTIYLDDNTQLYVGENISILKPNSGMNNSGFAVLKALKFLSFGHIDFVVFYDDMDFELGKIKLRLTGSYGGHNGIKSIIEITSRNDFLRIRLGIGRPKNISMLNHVLSNFNLEEKQKVQDVISVSAKIIEDIEYNSFNIVMNKFNKET